MRFAMPPPSLWPLPSLPLRSLLDLICVSHVLRYGHASKSRPPASAEGGLEEEGDDGGGEGVGRGATLRLTRPRPVFHQNSVADNVTDIETPSQGRTERRRVGEGGGADDEVR